MSERMTAVTVKGVPAGFGIAEYGRRPRSEMIETLRRVARRDLEAAQAILSAPDEAFIVETYVGVNVQRKREIVTE